MHWERGAELDPPPSMCHFWVGEQRRSLLATKVPRGDASPAGGLRWAGAARETPAHTHTRGTGARRGGGLGKLSVTREELLTAILTCLRFGLGGGCGAGIPGAKG